MKRVLILLFLAAFVSGCTRNVYTGRPQILLYTEPQMIKLGAVSYAELTGSKSKTRLITSGAAYAALQRVGYRIAAAVNKSYKWEFRLIDSAHTANAWALPGGKIAFYTGIFPVLQDEAGMAIVMGHEIMHALLNHSNERMSQSTIEKVVVTAAEIGFQNNEDRDTILGALGAGLTYGLILPYSRLHESEADKQGLFLAARAGYDPEAAIGVWERMDKRSAGKRKPEFQSTHPDPKNRIRKMREWMPEAKRLYAQSLKPENRALPPIR